MMKGHWWVAPTLPIQATVYGANSPKEIAAVRFRQGGLAWETKGLWVAVGSIPTP